MLMEVKPTRKCGWPVHIIYTAYYSILLPYPRLIHFHTWTRGIPPVRGLFQDNQIQNSTNPQLLSPWRQPDVVQCTSPPLHMQASPEGWVKRHLLLFAPAAAENKQGETKSQHTTHRWCQETVPKRNMQLWTHSCHVCMCLSNYF